MDYFARIDVPTARDYPFVILDKAGEAVTMVGSSKPSRLGDRAGAQLSLKALQTI